MQPLVACCVAMVLGRRAPVGRRGSGKEGVRRKICSQGARPHRSCRMLQSPGDLRSARLPVNSSGSPINFGHCLIGIPISSQSTEQGPGAWFLSGQALLSWPTGLHDLVEAIIELLRCP